MGLETEFGLVKQPSPVETENSASVTDAVIRDFQIRRESGKVKYGTELLSFNGRDPMIDLYQELLDAVVYIRQVLMERQAAPQGALASAQGVLERLMKAETFEITEGRLNGFMAVPREYVSMVRTAARILREGQDKEDPSS